MLDRVREPTKEDTREVLLPLLRGEVSRSDVASWALHWYLAWLDPIEEAVESEGSGDEKASGEAGGAEGERGYGEHHRSVRHVERPDERPGHPRLEVGQLGVHPRLEELELRFEAVHP